MRKARVVRSVVVAGLAAALCVFASPISAESGQEDVALTLLCKAPPYKARPTKLVLNGAGPLPDGTVLELEVHRVFESYAAGGLSENYKRVGGFSSEIQDKKYKLTGVVDAPGKFLFKVTAADAVQVRKEVVAELKKRNVKRDWQFTVTAWGDDLIGQLSPKAIEITELAAEAQEMIRKVETAAATPQSWKAQEKAMLKEASQLAGKVERSDVKTCFPAAHGEILNSLQNIQGSCPYLGWDKDGKVKAESYYGKEDKTKDPTQTFRQEEFSFANIKRYVDESIGIAAREMVLWIIKDMRRNAGAAKPEYAEAIRNSQKQIPALAIYAERVGKLTPADLDAMEAELRGGGAKKP